MEVPPILVTSSVVGVAAPVSVSVLDSGSPREVILHIRERAIVARQMGFTGDPCPSCQALQLVKNGTCNKCMSCGATTGCS